MNTANYPEAMTALRRSKRKCAQAFCWVFGVAVAGYWAAGRFDSAGIPPEVLLLPGGAWIAWRLLTGWQARRSPNAKPPRGYPRAASVERERAAAGVSSG